MNNHVFEGKWKQIRDQAKIWWGRLTDDDLEKVSSNYDNLIGMLQEKYGYSQKQAEYEYIKRVYKGWLLDTISISDRQPKEKASREKEFV